MDLLKLRHVANAIEDALGVYNTVDKIEENTSGLVLTVEGYFSDQNEYDFEDAIGKSYACTFSTDQLNLVTKITVKG